MLKGESSLGKDQSVSEGMRVGYRQGSIQAEHTVESGGSSFIPISLPKKDGADVQGTRKITLQNLRKSQMDINQGKVGQNFFGKELVDVTIENGLLTMWLSGRFGIAMDKGGFYGHFESHKKGLTWSLLKELNRRMNLPWLCARNFNEILNDGEKFGGGQRSRNLIANFQKVVDECEFHEIPVKGPLFTWSRGCAESLIGERIDRGLANIGWL
ncbi:hypothetical protein DITRI_Ditri10aG0080900 [Diplodiscus trichospermus]